jgi:hypothetical protein
MPSPCIALRLPPLPPAAHVRMSVAFTAGVAWQSDSGLSASWSVCNDEHAAAADEHIHAALLAARLLCLRVTRWSGAQVTRLSEVAATNARVQSVGLSQAQRRVVAAAAPAQSAGQCQCLQRQNLLGVSFRKPIFFHFHMVFSKNASIYIM